MDFFVVPTATFSLLYALVILRHDRRRVMHVNVTSHPTAPWVAQQLREAYPFDTAPRYLIRDRDGIYGLEVRECLKSLGIEEVVIAPRSPWQNPYVERLIGRLRRELLDHVVVPNERHLRKLLRQFLATYYHAARCHQSLDGNSPDPRPFQLPKMGKVRCSPLGVRLPASVKQSYRIHDGSGVIRLVAFSKWRVTFPLLPLSFVVGRWKTFQKLMLSGALDSDDFAAKPKGPIKKIWFHKAWVPVVDSREGSILFVDLSPEEGGKRGQIISHFRESGPSKVVAASFADFLEGIASELEHGVYVADKKSRSLIPNPARKRASGTT